MANYAVLENENIINIIIADSKEIAEEITGKVCIEYTDTDPVGVGGFYRNETFIQKPPYMTWVLNQDNQWVAPVDYPVLDPENPKEYYWSDDQINWVEIKN